jgi:replication initiation protein RepC
LMIIQKACGEIQSYAQGEIHSWADLIRATQFVRGMMGISQDAWERAQRAMGQGNAAVVLAAMLERISEINNPGGYLRALTNKAEAGAFSPGPMVMALLNKPEGAPVN